MSWSWRDQLPLKSDYTAAVAAVQAHTSLAMPMSISGPHFERAWALYSRCFEIDFGQTRLDALL